jgi:hypothetical protein
MKGRNHLEDLGIHRMIILMDVKGIGWEGMDWIHLT